MILGELIDRLAQLPGVQEAIDYDFPGWKGRLHWPMTGEVKSTVGYSVVASKTVTILRADDDLVLGDVKAYPNPCVFNESMPIVILPTIAWTNPGPGKVKIKIYNIAGELIKVIKEDMAALSAQWDMSTEQGNSASSGMYVIIIDGITDEGSREIKGIKFFILKQFNESNVIN